MSEEGYVEGDEDWQLGDGEWATRSPTFMRISDKKSDMGNMYKTVTLEISYLENEALGRYTITNGVGSSEAELMADGQDSEISR